jgi:ABC-type dipeptide/oligopeptide/nickel transport system permease component
MAIVGWILAGLIVMFLGCLAFNYSTKIDNGALMLFCVFISVFIMVFGLLIMFKPFVVNESNNETLNMKACKKIGGSYEVVDQTWNGKFYTDIYGCIKGE